MPLRKNHRQLIDEATAKITTLSLDEAKARLEARKSCSSTSATHASSTATGQIPGAFHAIRGMLEFDPDNPYFKEQLGEDRDLILYCQSGWHSALATATLVDMGRDNVSHIDGGVRRLETSRPTGRRPAPALLTTRMSRSVRQATRGAPPADQCPNDQCPNDQCPNDQCPTDCPGFGRRDLGYRPAEPGWRP